MKINIIKRENGIVLIENGKNFEIVIEDSILPEAANRKFEFITYDPVMIKDDEINLEGILINFKNSDYIEDIFSILSNRKDNDFHRIFIELNSLFRFKKEVSWEEFRGYVGEALFILNIGGVRTKNETDTFDIFMEDKKMVEVKTFSKQKKSITITHEQLTQGVEIFTVPLTHDEDGISIMELADKIADKEFGIEIKNKFKDSIYASYTFKNEVPTKLNWRPELNELPKGIFSASYNMNIEKPE